MYFHEFWPLKIWGFWAQNHKRTTSWRLTSGRPFLIGFKSKSNHLNPISGSPVEMFLYCHSVKFVLKSQYISFVGLHRANLDLQFLDTVVTGGYVPSPLLSRQGDKNDYNLVTCWDRSNELRCRCHSRFLPTSVMLLQRLQGFLRTNRLSSVWTSSCPWTRKNLSRQSSDVLWGVSNDLYPSREFRCGWRMGIINLLMSLRSHTRFGSGVAHPPHCCGTTMVISKTMWRV
jgi:hypothetical protein